MTETNDAPSRGKSPTRCKIMDAAEQLFAEHGYEACSFRRISELSGVNQGLLHYHFGSKQKLFSDVFLRRASELTADRLARLDAAEAVSGGRPVDLRTLVRDFVEPPLRMLTIGASGRAFIRIHAQLRGETGEFGLNLRRTAFGGSTQRYAEAFLRACPHLTPETVFWRFNCMIGTYLVLVTQSGRIEDVSGGLCHPADIDRALQQIVAFLVAGFEAPEPAARTQADFAAPDRTGHPIPIASL